MRKILFLMIALLSSVSGAWAQLTSISDGSIVTWKFQRVDNGASGWISSDFKNNGVAESAAGVFQFELAEASNTYYIKSYPTGNYIYASATTKSGSQTESRMALGSGTLPVATSGEQVDNLNAYKWVVNFNSTVAGKSYGSNVFDIEPSQKTDLSLALWSQTADANNCIILFDKGYNIAYFQFYEPSVGSLINAGCTYGQIKANGYSSTDIAEYFKPTKLDVVGWPTTTAYNTFKSAINALADDAVVNTAYVTPYNTMCTSVLLPEVGKFYTIYQPVAGKYIHAVTPDNSTNLAASTDGAVADAIFYVPYSGRFLSYTKGYAMSTNKIYSGYYGSGGYQTYTIDHYSGHPLGALRIKGGNYLAADAGSDYVWTSSYGAETSKYWTFTEVTSLPVTITAAKYASFCAPVAVTIPSGVTAYRAKSIDGSVVTLSSIDDGTIPANTGVILYANVDVATTYNFDITTGGTATSLLTGTTAAVSRPDYSYVLSKSSEGVVGFYGDGATTIPGFKAYYQGAGSVKGYSFRFDDETEVKSLDELPLISEGKMYDLSGRRIVKPTRGLYLSKGQKFVVK